MNTLDRMIPERMQFSSPDSPLQHSRLIDAFVDDTSLGFTDAGLLTLETLIAKLNTMAQTWENLLFLSGGALNLSKCSWYVMFWDWKAGRPQTRAIQHDDAILSLRTQGSTDQIPIKRLPLTQASRILGVHLAPNGDFSQQLIVLKDKADVLASRLRSPKLTPQDIQTFHRTMYTPAMKYVLPTMAVDEEALSTVQTKVLASMLQKLGYSSKLPTEIRHGPAEMGGLDLLDLRTELGISTLQFVRDAVYKGSEAGKLIILNVKYSQIESGIAEPLMEKPSIYVSYLTPSWILSVRQFLHLHNMTLTLTDTIHIEIRGKEDRCIMNAEALTRYDPTQQRDINLVRLYLQVITLSDMSTPDGLDACPFHSHGNRRPGQRIRLQTWPRQEEPTAKQKRLWKRYIASNYLRYGTKWIAKLSAATITDINPPSQENLPHTDTKYSTFQEHIRSLPPWFRRLLFEYQQIATDVEVWREFRSRRRLIISTDGSLLDTAGTFGWKITNDKFKPLFKGAGPIDGPIEIGSSTRSELGGFTAPLLLVTILARHWGLKHRCKFKWLADSRVALSRVTIVTRPDHTPTKQPDNVDYVSVIRDLFQELRRPMQAHWVKSHQDAKTPYAKLTPEAKLNVDADELATLFHQSTKGKPMRATPHINSTKISITILKTRYPGNINMNLKYHINGGYMRRYLQHSNKWADTTWTTIDMVSFGRHFKQIPMNHKSAHLKLIHNQLSLGTRKYKCSPVDDLALRLCPCCGTTDEDNPHFLQCTKNPARVEAEQALMKTLLSDDHPSRPAIASCIQQHLADPVAPPEFYNDKFPEHMRQLLEEAMTEQATIGWHHMILGYLSNKWQELSASDRHPFNKSEPPAGKHRIQQILKALSGFTRALWLGRNDVLHKEKDSDDRKVYSIESAELRHYHTNPHLLPSTDQHYCATPLRRLLQSRPSVRRRWLRRVKAARAAFLKNGRQQQRITQYFAVERPPDPIPPAPNIMAGHKAHRTKTTQQRMTEHFTGRPPDTRSARPTNPSLPQY